MKIEHIAMYVRNLEASRDFYVKWFGACANDGYHNPRTGLRTYFLTFEDGARLELMNRPGLSDGSAAGSCFGLAHIAFCLGSEQRVDSLTEELKKAGYTVVSGPRRTGDGYYESCICDNDGNLVELTA